MDLLIYCVALFIIGFARINKTSNVQNEPMIVSESMIPVDTSIPVGNNLGLVKIPGAYTAILKELGLER